MRPKALSGSIAKYSRGLALSVLTLIGASQAPGAIYYWDTNGDTAGSGAATGTWGTDNFWSTDATGATATVAQTIDNTSDVFFSAGTNGTGGTVTISGTQAAHSITFDDGVIITLSGGTAINLGSATAGSGLFFTGNAANVISTDIILNSAATAIEITNSTASLQTIGAITGSAGTQTLTVGATSTGGITLGGIIGNGGGTVALTVNSVGTGITTLSNANTYTGTTTINGGTLTLNRFTGSLSSSTALTFGGTGTFNMDNTGAGGALAQSLAALTFSAGDGTVNITRTAAQNQTITFSSLAARGVGATGNFVNTGGTNSATNGFILTGVTANAAMGPGYFFAGGTTGANYAFYDSTGFVRGLAWTGAEGTTSVGGALTSTAYRRSTGSTTATIATGQSFTGLNFQNTTGTAQAVTLAGTITTNGILRSGNGASTTISGGTSIATTTAGVDLVIRTDMANDALTITTPIIASGASGLTKSGAGTLTLSGTNTYTGATYVNAGTLVIAAAGSLGSGTYAGAIANSGTSFTYSSSANQTLSGIISGTGALTKNTSSTSTLTLTNENTYTGTTTISAGTMQVGNGLTGSLNGTAGTALTFGGNGSFIVSEASGVSQGMGTLTFSAGNGTITSTNNGGTSSLTFSSLAARSLGATGNFVLSGGTAGIPGTPASGSLGTNNIVLTTGATASQLIDRGFFYNGSAYAAYDAAGFVRGLAYGTDTNAPAAIAGGGNLGVNDATQNVQITGAITAQGAASVNTINLGANNFTITAGQTLSVNGLLSTGTLTFGAAVNQGTIRPTSSGGEIVVNANAGTLTLNSVIANNGTTSTLTKSGAGTLTLSGTNTYNGPTYVNGGTLSISSNANLGNENTGTGSVTVASSSTNNGSVTLAAAPAPAGLTIGSSLLGSVVTSISGTAVTIAGYASSTITVNTSTPFSFVGNSLFLNGATLRTTANVGLFNGTWGTNNRPIAISNGATFNTEAGTLTVGGGISGTGGLTKTGNGTMTIIGGTTNSFTGGVVINGGTLFLNWQNSRNVAAVINTSNSLTLAGGTLQTVSGNQVIQNQAFSSTKIAAGTSNALFLQIGSGGNTATYNFNAITRESGSILNITLSNNQTNANFPTVQTTNANSNGILGPWATISRVNTTTTAGLDVAIRYATMSGGNIIHLPDNTVADASLFADATANYNFTTTGTTPLTSSRTANTARYSGVGGTINLGSGSNTLTLGGLLNAGPGTLTIDGTGGSGTVVVEATSNELVVNAANAAVAISAPITNNGVTAGTLTKTGSNRLTLSGANTYTGGTYLNAGVLALGSTTALGTVAGTLRIYGGSLDSTVANLVNANNNAQTWNRDFTFVGTNSLNLGTGAVTLTDNRTVAVTASTLTVGGIIGDGGSGFGLTKSGLGTLVLNGVNTFSGATSVTQGAIGGTGTIAGAVTVSSTGGINLVGNGTPGTLTLSSTLAITGSAGANNLYFDLGAAAAGTDKIAATGAFSMTNSGAAVVTVNQIGGVATRADTNNITGYDIITAASGLSAANFQLATTKAFGQTFGLTSPNAQTLRLTTSQVGTDVGNKTLSVANSSWATAANFSPSGLPDYRSNVTISNNNMGTTSLNGSTDINSLTFTTSMITGSTISAGTATAGTPASMLVIEAAGVNSNTAGDGITLNNTSGTHTISANIGLAASQKWAIAGTTGGLTVSGVISDFGAGYGLTKAGTGTLTLSGANTFTGAVSITNGTLSVNSLPNGGVASPLGMSGGAASNLLLGNGTTLTYTGGAASTDRSFTINGTAASHGATLNASGSAAINFTNTASPAYGTADQTRTLTLTGTSGFLNTLAANIADNGTGAVSVAKTSSGTWVLSGNSSFTGGLTLSGGAVRVSSDANLGAASGQITVTSDSTLQIGVSAAATVASSRQINLNGGTLSFTFGFADTNSFSTSGKVTGSGNILATLPGGQNFTLSLNSTSNDFTGSVTIDAANNGGSKTLLVNAASLADATGSGNIRFGRTNSLTVMTQQFTYTGTSDLTLNNRKIEFITGSAANSNSVLSSTLAAITVNTDLVVASGGNSKLTLDAPTGITSTFNGKLINGSLATLITKTGAGTWVLTGANTYTGATSITGGTLIARDGTAFGTTGTANVTVATQTGMSYYAATDVPLNIAGTLGITGGTATVIGGSIGSTTTSAQINVAGNATATAAAIKVNIYGNSFSTTTSGTNTYTLVKGNGGANTLSTATSLTLGTVYNNTNFTVGALSKTTSTIDVAITQQTALSGNVFWKGGLTGATGVWSASNGTTQSNWQVTDTVNQPLAPSSTSDLVFSTATSPGTMVGMALGSDVSVRTMTINNTATAFGLRADGYTLTLTPASSTDGIVVGSSVPASTIAANVALGASQTWTNNSVNSLTVSGRVSGGGNNLTTAGTGTIILSGANTYTGATTISAGTLQIGNGGTTGSLSPSSAITNDAALVFNRTDTITQGTHFASTISGTGTVTQAGTGTLALSVANTYSGATSILQGTLEVTANNALGTNAAGTTVASGATLKLTGVNYSTTEGLIINGTGVSSGGALASSGTSTFAGLITAATNATINAISGTLELSGGLVKDGTTLTFTGAGAFTISSVISGASANSDLVVDATTVTLAAANTYNGPTTITNGGTLIANALDALPLSPRSAVSFTGTGTSALNLGANQFVASLSSAGAATVALGSNTLTVGIAGGNTTFAGSINGTGGNLVKDTNSTQVLSGANGYTGTTTVSAGTLEVQGSLSGTTAVTVNTSGTLLLNSAASPIINTAATMTVGGGTVKIDNSLSNTNQTFGSLTLTGTSILDFGTGSNGNTMTFSSLSFTGTKLNVYNWSGSAYGAGVADGGTFADTQDRLLFNADTIYSGTEDSRIEFFSDSGITSLGFGQEVAFGSQFELVPITAVPEPATTALIGSIALCALIGYRERRRFTGLGKRMAARK
jgi:autotransporter-associated beta strand protein